MGRSRRHVPPATEVGVWFSHRGANSAGSLARDEATSTGVMLSGPFKSSSARIPQPPPSPFSSKTDVNYRTSNRFSEHDNRHSFQNHGVYFGDGRDNRQLGRYLVSPDQRMHHTENTFLKHFGRDNFDFDYHTNYQNSYKGKNSGEVLTYRRYSKALKTPSPGPIPLGTTTTDWHPSSAKEHQSDTQVLAVSQEPFLKHNAWKYSYHHKRNVYPPYDRRSLPAIDNTFNRYGAAFSSGAFTSGALDSTVRS